MKFNKRYFIGKQFNKLIPFLTIRKPNSAHIYLKCLCECGKEIDVRATLLKNNNIVSCGCHSRFNLIGQKFGRLTVIAFSKKNKNKHLVWECKCICGKIKYIEGDVLKRGDANSCGCIQLDKNDLSGKIFGKLHVLRKCKNKKDKAVWLCECWCGSFKNILADSLLSNNTKSCGSCYRKSEYYPFWERGKKRCDYGNIHDWSKQVLSRDNNTCQVCGRKNVKLAAHHLDAWNWCVSRRFDISNGITLCDDKGGCHKKFHKIYGRGSNTLEQFNEFKLCQNKEIIMTQNI